MARSPSQERRAKRLGARIRARREELGLTRVEVAARIPVRDSTLGRYETGTLGPPDDEVIVRLARILDLPERELMHVAGRGIDPDAFEERALRLLEAIADEQRAGLRRIEAAIARLGGGEPERG